jgi:excisionase family DNA binding protein
MTASTSVLGEKANIPQLHDVREARRRLNVGLTKFYELVNQGELRTVKIGRRRLVSEESIAEFISRLEANLSLPNQPEKVLTEEAA